LHGNVYKEYGELNGCKRIYYRDFYTPDDETDILLDQKKIKLPIHAKICSKCENNHYTPRKCDNCNTYLKDSIINFGDDLDDETFDNAEENAKKADCVLVLGSTCTVSPANQLVTANKNSKIIVVNRQNIALPKDTQYLHIYADCDDIMNKIKINMERNALILSK